MVALARKVEPVSGGSGNGAPARSVRRRSVVERPRPAKTALISATLWGLPVATTISWAAVIGRMVGAVSLGRID